MISPKDIFPELPEISEEMRLSLHRKYAEPYLFYKKHSSYIDCYCTHCLTRYQLRYDKIIDTPFDSMCVHTAYSIAHDVRVTCPHCQKQVIARSEGIPRQKLTERYPRVIFLPTTNAVYAVACEIVCGYGWDKMTIDEMSDNYGGSKIVSYGVIEYKPGSVRGADYWYYSGWQETKEIIEPYTKDHFYGKRIYFKAESPEVLQDTFMRYYIPRKYKTGSEITTHEYKGYKPLEFLAYAVKYPAVEMLIKNGGDAIIEDIIDRQLPHKRVIDLEGKTPAEVFKVDSNEAAVIRKAMQYNRVDLATLQCWYRLKVLGKKDKHKYKFADALNLYGFSNDYNDTINLIKSVGLTPAKFINYINRQCEVKHDCPMGLMMTYKDYIKECIELQYDIKDTQISKPADLYIAHNRTSSALQAVREERARKEQSDKQKLYRKLYKKWRTKYEYTDDKYTIIVPTCAADIVAEGRNQGHCVAGYADRHMQGKLTILFMRNAQYPATALYTIEMHENRLVQIRGKKNSSPTPEALQFVKKWLEYVKLPATKKRANKKESAA